MIIKREQPFPPGYTEITGENGPEKMYMDFGILRMEAGHTETEKNADPQERVFLLIKGKIKLSRGKNGETRIIERKSYLDESPWLLHVPAGETVQIELPDAEATADIALAKRTNSSSFESKLYIPEETRSAEFGKGSMQETSTRTVRTILDYENAPHAGLVIGEVVNHPGKWSSYPPHSHLHPEIYHYRFSPEQGFGISMTGDNEAYVVRDGDTSCLQSNHIHSQCSAPGYAMYYIWIIPHLPQNPWLRENNDFPQEHTWVSDPKAKIWPDQKEI